MQHVAAFGNKCEAKKGPKTKINRKATNAMNCRSRVGLTHLLNENQKPGQSAIMLWAPVAGLSVGVKEHWQ